MTRWKDELLSGKDSAPPPAGCRIARSSSRLAFLATSESARRGKPWARASSRGVRPMLSFANGSAPHWTSSDDMSDEPRRHERCSRVRWSKLHARASAPARSISRRCSSFRAAITWASVLNSSLAAWGLEVAVLRPKCFATVAQCAELLRMRYGRLLPSNRVFFSPSTPPAARINVVQRFDPFSTASSVGVRPNASNLLGWLPYLRRSSTI
mmetsp:Transcript_70241/g.222705  ORF Transcript_70241/g.222705 Transcript_70241/m.222705 type:complete len:211 (+) Transcript_70241:76-708(+)